MLCVRHLITLYELKINRTFIEHKKKKSTNKLQLLTIWSKPYHKIEAIYLEFKKN